MKIDVFENRWWFGIAIAALAVVSVSWGCSRRGVERGPEEREAQQVGAQTASEEEGERRSELPDRVILMIGDGMGAAAVAGAEYTSEERLNMLTMEQLNFITTHSHEFVTTDSAASATAFATGNKTHYQGVSVTPGTTKESEEDEDHQMETVLERAQKRGWKTGLVATVRAVHATPAAFAAHRAHRDFEEAIAGDMATSEVDVLVGGGRNRFTDRDDGVNLLEEFERRGYTVAKTGREFAEAGGVAERLVGLLGEEDLPSVRSQERSRSLEEMTETAIEVLDRNNEEGFFLMVEGSQIDWRGHGLDGEGTIASTRHFDRAVGRALEYGRSRDDTLVIVVADHETGGLSLVDSSQKEELTAALGGEEEARSSVSYRSEGEDSIEAPDPFPEMEVERRHGGGADSESLVPLFGYFSIASRPYAEKPEEFFGIHTPEMIPMFVDGKGASYVADAGDNASVGRRLFELVRGERSKSIERHEQEAPSSEEERPRNVVLFVGDGVGFDALTLGEYGAGPLAVRTMRHRGLAAPLGGDSLVPGDREAASVLATGRRSADGDGESRARTVLEMAETKGYRTGLVTTESLTDATPAAMYAEGSGDSSVADDFVSIPARWDGSDGLDVAYGGGASYFGAEHRERMEERGVDVGEEWEDGGDVGRQVVRLLSERGLPVVADRRGDGSAADLPTLDQMTRTALERLQAFDAPFFLVVEAGVPGRLQRGLDRSEKLVDAIGEFDAAVEEGREFAQRDGDTLVVATADADQTLSVMDNHYGFNYGVCGVAKRCGGPYEMRPLSVSADGLENAAGLTDVTLQGEYAPPELFAEYAWAVQAGAEQGEVRGMNTVNFVPVFATGPWSGRFEGAYDQTHIGKQFVKWAKSGR